MVKSVIDRFEKEAINESIETACVIAKDGTVYKCFGIEDRVFPDNDLGDILIGAKVSHNHPIDVTEYSFSKNDFMLFSEFKLEELRGCDKKYTYKFTRNKKDIDEHKPIFEFTEYDVAHEESISIAERNNIGYRRWLND